MFAIVAYEIKVAVVLAVFYLCYKLLLSKETLHRVNRAVLVGTAVLSFFLPLCVLTFHRVVEVQAEPGVSAVAAPLGMALPDDSAVTDVIVTAAKGFDWQALLLAVYLAGAAMVLISIVIGLVKVLRVIRNGEVREWNGQEVVVTREDVAPFSWMKWIVMSEEDFRSGNSHILEHERAHIALGHSKDVLLVDTLSAFQWFNPVIWLLKADLRAVHEYEADDAVLRRGVNIKEYQYSLIRKAVSASGYSITNSFNHSILKNRITMMCKSKTSPMAGLRALYIVPLVCAALACNSRTVTDYKVSENSPEVETSVPTDELVFEFVKADSGETRAEDGYVLTFEGLPLYIDEARAIIVDSMKEGEETCVTLKAPGEMKCGYLDDVKQMIREIDAVKVRYSCPDVAVSAERDIPLSGEAGGKMTQTGLEPDSEVDFKLVPRERIHIVRVNSQDKVLFDTDVVDVEDIFETALNVMRADRTAVFSYQQDRGTSYGAYVSATQQLYGAVNTYRDEYARQTFGKSLDQLTAEEYGSVLDEVGL